MQLDHWRARQVAMLVVSILSPAARAGAGFTPAIAADPRKTSIQVHTTAQWKGG